MDVLVVCSPSRRRKTEVSPKRTPRASQVCFPKRRAVDFILIFLATLTWTMGYDTIYAMLDRKEDQKIGIKSTALLFGKHTWLALGALFGLTSVFLLLLGLQTTRTSIYYFSLVLMGFCFIYQVMKVKENPSPELTFTLFKSHVGIGILVLAGILLDFWNQQHKGVFL